MEHTDSNGDEIPRRRKGRSKGREAGEKATNPEGNEEALSVTSYPCPKGFSLFMTSSRVPLSLNPVPWQLDLGLGILGRGASPKFHALAEEQAPSLTPPFGAIFIKSFPKTGQGIRLTSGKADAPTCPLSPCVEKGGRQKEGARDSWFLC